MKASEDWFKLSAPSVTEEVLSLSAANSRSAFCCDGHPGTVANGFVVLGPHKLGSLTDLAGFQGQEDVSGLLVHAGHDLLDACEHE